MFVLLLLNFLQIKLNNSSLVSYILFHSLFSLFLSFVEIFYTFLAYYHLLLYSITSYVNCVLKNLSNK
nr:MAG TPA: hypothetical protein [Caudoviricetes sp.]